MTRSERGTDIPQRARLLLGRLGLICLLLIVPIKVMRFLYETEAGILLVGIVPSLLGPAGLLFLILSAPGKLSRPTLLQTTCAVFVISMVLEFVQLLPRPGILRYVFYTFDWLDILAGFVSVSIGFLVALVVRNTPHFGTIVKEDVSCRLQTF
ncbi:MAG TPA: hypothetical protein VJB38_06665 [Bacteroidota bacterium]|nr:hypothetical protein [Bacteroidota bacterium]